MNNADLIVATLKKAGVTHGFGIPSGNVLPLMEAMRTGGIEFILTAHEGSAGFAADVMGRQTGKPGFCIATLGPGATNLSTGVGNAWLDRSPMIAITCNLNTEQQGRRIQMWIDHHQLFKPITKASYALNFDNVADTLSKAISLALSEPMGPVHIDLPEDVALAAAQKSVADFVPLTSLTIADQESVNHAANILLSAKRPLAVIGANALRLREFSSIRSFIEKWSIPFMTTTMAKGILDDRHPLGLGCIERAKRQIQRAFCQKADLIVGIGYDTIEVEYEAWIASTPLLQIDLEPVDIANTVNLKAELTGDILASLNGLSEIDPADFDWSPQELESHRKNFQTALRPFGETLQAHEAIDTVRRVLPENGILSFDVGAHTHQIASQWTAHHPKEFLITNGWSSMGFGLPGAIAAKIADPEKPVVCLIGDGCFQMTCGEVATAKRLGISLPIVVLDDRWLGLIRVKQIRRQLNIYGTELGEIDYDDPPAHYFGVPAIGVKTIADLESELKAALTRVGPTVIEARVNSDHYIDTVFD
jgi:acetolactate synthase-1/2/3 large subunit